MEGVAVGRIVHFKGDIGGGDCRAALIVRDWQGDNGVVNLAVFPDGSNDVDYAGERGNGPTWRTSVVHADHAPEGSWSWHWPERA